MWLGVDRHARGVGRAGDEALVRVRAVELGPADRVGAEVGPVDVLGVDRHPGGLDAPVMKLWFGFEPSSSARPIVPVK